MLNQVVLRVVRPLLPDFVDRLDVRGLRVGSARADLRFRRQAGGVAVEIRKIEGDPDVVVESGTVGPRTPNA